MISRLALLLFVSGCSTNPPCTVEYRHEPASLDSVVLPSPIKLKMPGGITNESSHWELTHEDWASLVQWQSEVDRYLRDLRGTWKDALDAVEDHNLENQPQIPEEPTEKPTIWSKLNFWSKEKEVTQ
jgi:hypothetical protein